MKRVYNINDVEMKSEGYLVSNPNFIERGEYKETELDKYKRSVDFLITSVGNHYEIRFNHDVDLKESRSIRKSEWVKNVFHVTENALSKLKQQYTWATDF